MITFRRALKEGNSLINENKVNEEFKNRTVKIHLKKDPYGNSTLESLQELMFDKSKKKEAFDKLRSGFLKDTGSNIFAPRLLMKKTLSGGKIGLVYQGYKDRKFTVIADPEGRTQKVQGRHLNLKPEGVRGNTGKDQMFIKNMNFNSAHLIADWFGGPGQSRAYNIVTTSDYYNKIIMLGIEERIVDDFTSFTKPIMNTNKLEDVYFNLDVSIEYEDLQGELTKIVDLIVAEEMPNYKDKTKADITKELMEFYKKHKDQASIELKRVKNVIYAAKFVAQVNGKSEIQSKGYRTDTPDIWLGLDKEKK